MTFKFLPLALMTISSFSSSGSADTSSSMLKLTKQRTGVGETFVNFFKANLKHEA